MSYDNWRTTTPADRSHIEECNCDSCHRWHVENGKVREFSEMPDFECCEHEMFERIKKGEWCVECDSDAYIKDGLCFNTHKDGKCHKLKEAA